MIDLNNFDLEAVFSAHANDGVETIIKIIKDQLPQGVWKATTRLEKQEFNREVSFRVSCYSSARYASERLDQLLQSNFNFWVFHHDSASERCDEKFAELDGLALPPAHPFWLIYYPPHMPGCICSVSGAGTNAGIIRLRGVPGKPIPAWCLESIAGLGAG